jgi:hypothetical protein
LDQWGQSRLIRESTSKGWVLVSERFKDMIEKQLSRKLAPLDRGVIEDLNPLLGVESSDSDPIDSIDTLTPLIPH